MSEIRAICRKTFQDVVANAAECPPELRKALRSHERVPVFLDNLAREFGLAEKRGLKLKRETIEEAARDLTRVFIQCVQRQAEERLLSPLAVAVKQAEINRRKQIIADADRLTQGAPEHVTTDAQGNETSVQQIKI